MASSEIPTSLGEVVRLVRGTTYKSALLGQPGPVLLGLASIQRNGGFRTDSLKTYGGESKPNILLQPGDLFVSLKDVTQSADLLGAIARVPESVTAGRLTQDTVKLEFGNSDYPRNLVYWALRTPAFRSYCREHATGTTNLGLARDDFLAYRLPSPSSHALDLVDLLEAIESRIDLLRQTNATLEAIAQALFKSWFVDFDPVRAKAEGREPEGMDAVTAELFPSEFEKSKLELIPKGWQFSPIREVVEEVFDGPHATPAEATEGPVFLGIKNLTGTALNLSEIRHIQEHDWPRWTKRVTPRANDIVFSYEAALGLFALIPPNLRCCLGRRLALVRTKSNAGEPHFWFHQFISAPFQRLLSKHTVQGATVNRIALKEFPSFPVLEPCQEIRSVFEHLAAPLWARIHLNQQQALDLAELRDTLLPRLISGKLRLPEVEKVIEEAVA